MCWTGLGWLTCVHHAALSFLNMLGGEKKKTLIEIKVVKYINTKATHG